MTQLKMNPKMFNFPNPKIMGLVGLWQAKIYYIKDLGQIGISGGGDFFQVGLENFLHV